MAAKAILAALIAVTVPMTASAQTAALSGTVTYRERVALPPTAVLEVWIEDVSRPDTPGAIIGSARIARPVQVPFTFAVGFDPSDVSETHRYAVRARITDGKTILFATSDTTLVLTQGHGSSPNLVLQMMRQPSASAPVAPPAPPLPPSPVTGLPLTFTGTLPCADCQGVRYHLNLFADDSFFLRRSYLGKPGSPVDEIGSFALSSDRRALVLKGHRDFSESFLVSAPGVLRQLDANGGLVEAKAGQDLRRAATFHPVEVQTAMRGAYSASDGGSFVECATGQRWPVAAEGANQELESTYARARLSPGSSVLVEIEGRVASRTSARGGAPQPTLVVNKIVRWLPRERCAARFVSAPLGDTTWRLTRIAGKDVPASRDARREATLTFDENSETFSGSTGCNRLIGQYTIDQATMSPVPSGTLVACRNEAHTEAAMMSAIKATRAYRITGRVLELLDGKGTPLARFEARTSSGITVK